MRSWKILRRGFLRAGFILGIGLLCLKSTQADVTPPQTGPCNNMEASNIPCPYASPTASCSTYSQSLCNGKAHVVVVSNTFGWTEKEGSNAFQLVNNGNNIQGDCSYSTACFWDVLLLPDGGCRDSGLAPTVDLRNIYDSYSCSNP